MYGVAHKGLTAWLKKLDETGELLKDARDSSDITGTLDDFFRSYEQHETDQLLSIVSELTGKTVEQCLYHAGVHFLAGIMDSGYAHTIQALGETLFEMLENIDSLHESFIPSFPKMRSPSFRPVRLEDNSMLVSYYSESSGLAPFAMGALKACAEQLFELECDVRHTLKRGEKGSSHDEFRLFVDEKAYPPTTSFDGLKSYSTITVGSGLHDKLLPWHFAFDSNLIITSVGSSLRGRIVAPKIIGEYAPSLFKLIVPVATPFDAETFESCEKIGFTFILKKKFLMKKVTTNSTLDEALEQQDYNKDDDLSSQAMSLSRNSSFAASQVSSGAAAKRSAKLIAAADVMKLHGQVDLMKNGDYLFSGTPLVRGVEELHGLGLELKDMPLHSHARDVLFGSMFLATAAKNFVVVDQRLAALDGTMKEVEVKKSQIDGLLHSILPPVVANSLASGSIPPAEQYDNVTVLMADIFNFTQISSEIPAAQVMNMLHELFVKFDDLTEKHGCYKVETNGDCYTVAAGCPEVQLDHAERIAYLAIDMVQIAKEVINPLDGEPLHVRIGLHSGPLMAGVVGRARPRYCLFGDTVNMTEQMVANGLPGSIQATYRFVMALPEDHPLKLVSRGHINIEGKGFVKSFLLLGSDFDEDIDAALPTATHAVDIAPMLNKMTESTSARELQERIAHIQASKGLRMRNAVMGGVGGTPKNVLSSV